MNISCFLSSWLKRFLLEHLITICNLSRNTQKSYRDTFRLCIELNRCAVTYQR